MKPYETIWKPCKSIENHISMGISIWNHGFLHGPSSLGVRVLCAALREVWTFLRDAGSCWQLPASQQVHQRTARIDESEMKQLINQPTIWWWFFIWFSNDLWSSKQSNHHQSEMDHHQSSSIIINHHHSIMILNDHQSTYHLMMIEYGLSTIINDLWSFKLPFYWWSYPSTVPSGKQT